MHFKFVIGFKRVRQQIHGLGNEIPGALAAFPIIPHISSVLFSMVMDTGKHHSRAAEANDSAVICVNGPDSPISVL